MQSKVEITGIPGCYADPETAEHIRMVEMERKWWELLKEVYGKG